MQGADVEDCNSADAQCLDEPKDIYLQGDFYSETERGPDKRFGDIVTHMVFIVPA